MYGSIDSDEEIDAAGKINWFHNAPLGQLIYDRTYARKIHTDECQQNECDCPKETWPDTVRRVVDGNLAFVDSKFIEPNEKEELYSLLLKRQLIPAGRHLWVTGVPGRAFTQNCHVAGFETGLTEHCAFVFSELMKGGGVGANYSSQYLSALNSLSQVEVRFRCDRQHADYDSLLPLLGETFDSNVYIFKVPDSREGWVEALSILLEAASAKGYKGCGESFTVVYDVSDVRPKGSPIRGFGGISSGPLPLVQLLFNVADLIKNKEVSPLLVMEIDHLIASAVIAGNVRRSARMSIMHWNDPDIALFLQCKADHLDHWSTNISVEIDNKFLHDLNVDGSHAQWVYERVIEGMLENGEPGFYNSSLASTGERTHLGSTNPCLTGDTVIATVDGPRTFESLAETEQDVLVYSWHPETKLPVVRTMRRPHKTASNVPILEVEFDSGLKVRCTPDHSFYSFRGKKIKAKDLKIGKSVRAWSMSEHRDGHLRVHGWDAEANSAAHQWVARMVYENFYGTVPEGFLVHHKDENKLNNHISNLEAITATEHNQEHYQGRLDNGFHWTNRQENKFYGNQYTKNHKVIGVRQAGFEDVYNGTVDDAHTYIILDPDAVAGVASGIVSANCGEMPLEPWESCNLGHINLAWGTDEQHRSAFRLMARFLVRATFCDIQDTKQREVVERNRRIGVGFFGLQEWLGVRGIKYSNFQQHGILADYLTNWYNIVREEANRYADELSINRPIKVTTIAPTGTIAKLAGTSEGIQPIYAKYYIRRVRYSENDPEIVNLKALGIPLEPDLQTPGTLVASFPCEDPILERVFEEYVEEQHDISAETALAIQAYVQRYYVDNAISLTVNVPTNNGKTAKEKLFNSIKKYLPYIKGTTVFPEASRPQSPIERISKEEYDIMVHTQSINSGTSDILFDDCSTGACPIR